LRLESRKIIDDSDDDDDVPVYVFSFHERKLLLTFTRSRKPTSKPAPKKDVYVKYGNGKLGGR